MNETNTATTSMALLPRAPKMAKTADCDDACICCGKIVKTAAHFVVTEQGEYIVGVDCAKKCRAAGFEVVPA